MQYLVKSLCAILLTTALNLYSMEPVEPRFIRITSRTDGQFLVIDQSLLPPAFGVIALTRMKEAQAGELSVDYSSRLFPLLKSTLHTLKGLEGTDATGEQIEQHFRNLFATSAFSKLFTDNLKELGAQIIDMFEFFGFPIESQTALKRQLREAAKVHYIANKEEIELPGVEPIAFSIREVVQRNLLKEDAVQINPANQSVTINLTDSMLDSINGIDELIKLKNVTIDKIVTLNLNNNRFKEIDDNFIKFLTNASRLINLLFENNKLEKVPDDFSTVLAPRIQVLSLALNLINTLPDNFLSTAPALRQLGLGPNLLLTLPAHFLEHAPNLQYLTMSHNPLTSLPLHFLANSPNIQLIILNGTLIPPKIIQTLPNHVQKAIATGDKEYKEQLAKNRPYGPIHIHDLIHLNQLRDNTITRDTDGSIIIDLSRYGLLDTYGIEELLVLNEIDPAQVRVIFLSRNKLTQITPKFNAFLARLPNLRSLSLAINRLTVLPEDFLSNTPNLRVLDLSSNRITALPPKFLAGSTTIEMVFLAENLFDVPQEILATLAPHVQKAIAVGDKIYKANLAKQAAQKKEQTPEPIEIERQ